MKTKAKLALVVGAGVIALGAAIGVGALAANLAGGEPASSQAGSGQGRAGSDARSGRNRIDTAELARTLATRLGVDEQTVAAALTEVMAADRPRGARNGGSGFLETMAESLAGKLNLDEAKVLAALQESMPGR